MNDECWYVREHRVRNKKVFKKIDDIGRRMCAFCPQTAMKSIESCSATKFTVRGKSETLVVHIGIHDHALEEVLDGSEVERYKVSAITTGSERRQVRLDAFQEETYE